LDRLERLTRRLLEDLDRQGDRVTDRCVDAADLGQLIAGTLDTDARERANAHLDGCLACLNRFVELHDHLQGIAAPAPVAPALARALDTLIGRQVGASPWRRLVAAARRALDLRVPAWAAAGAAAGVLITVVAVHRFQQPGAPVDWPVDFSSPGQLTPTNRQMPRTISGVVSSIQDATSNGVEAHVVSVKDTAGATYVIFAWGRPTVGLGDSVEIDAIFTAATPGAGKPVYQGVATQLRRAR
jgi:hypothetical protein